MEEKKPPKTLNIFVCDICDFKCSKNRDYSRHLLTSKHKNMDFGSNLEEKKPQKAPGQFICECDKLFKTHSGLWKHRKICKTVDDDKLDISTLDMNLIMQILKQNDEFKSLMVEQNNKMMETFQETMQETIQEVCKNGITNNSVNQVNSHNKTFNLNVFLNEQCKNAMNIMEFVDTIKLDLDDAESVRKLGYVNGISNIIIKHLKALDVHMRPVHCTDLKRETVYVKYQDVWEKEGDDNKLMRKAIKHVAVKNYNAADIFKELHPDCMNWDSKHGDHFSLLRIEALGGKGNINIYDSHTKIIKKIAKEITIDKSC
jgi:hypothetical protein